MSKVVELPGQVGEFRRPRPPFRVVIAGVAIDPDVLHH
jgi:hypothetical protein